jgi:hypothetical protein
METPGTPAESEQESATAKWKARLGLELFGRTSSLELTELTAGHRSPEERLEFPPGKRSSLRIGDSQQPLRFVPARVMPHLRRPPCIS